MRFYLSQIFCDLNLFFHLSLYLIYNLWLFLSNLGVRFWIFLWNDFLIQSFLFRLLFFLYFFNSFYRLLIRQNSGLWFNNNSYRFRLRLLIVFNNLNWIILNFNWSLWLYIFLLWNKRFLLWDRFNLLFLRRIIRSRGRFRFFLELFFEFLYQIIFMLLKF
jgi:hypothetical protein